MNFSLQKFFITLIDLFSVIMAGAMLVYFAKDRLATLLDTPNGLPLKGGEESLIFLFASYLSGYFIFLLSNLLDKKNYDPLRDCTDWEQMSKLKKVSNNRI